MLNGIHRKLTKDLRHDWTDVGGAKTCFIEPFEGAGNECVHLRSIREARNREDDLRVGMSLLGSAVHLYTAFLQGREQAN